MKKLFLFVLVVVIVSLQACCPKTNESEEVSPIIGKQDLKLNSDIMTPEVLWSFGRLSDAQVSPDNSSVLFGVSYYDKEQNKSNRDLYSVKVDGKDLKQLTKTRAGEYNAQWRPDGKKIGFLSTASGSVQIWEMNTDGSDRNQITFVDGGITGYKYSPDMTKLLYTKEVKVDKDVHDMHPDLPLATGRLENDLMYRHWDEWVDTYSHVFYADYDGTKIWNDKDINEGELFQTPLKPWGGIEQVDWTTDSKTIAYTCKKLYGKAATLSTNSDIYFYNLESGKTKNMTKGMMGFDIAPVFSPDGNYMAWESMEREGFESDKNRLYIMNLRTGDLTYATENFDQNVGSITWTPDSKEIYFNSDWHGAFQIYKYTLSTGKIVQITKGMQDYRGVALAGDKIIAPMQTMSLPTELFAINPENGEAKQITFTNKDLLDQLTMGEVEERWIKTDDNKDLQVFVIYPPNFDPNKKYPTILYCKGGPQGPLSQSFHYRWNYQIMVANDYIIVAPARRGVSGFGQAWQEQISGDYHGKSMQDYLNAIDAMAKEPFVDEDRLGAIGASAGGWAVYYLAGNHEGRFKAFIAHDGIFNEEAQYLETEEMWFENWDKGGPFWEKNNKIAKDVYAHSPHKFVDKWDTPILCIHGELDYRVVVTQGMTAFNAAILKGVPAEYLYFPDENHWVLQPQNGILWQRTFFNWLDRWLK
ncbi:MAG: S9 family peptidase [Bacteroidales bacterium]|nr:S9 family peptidase [Bacteroidales bacterium]